MPAWLRWVLVLPAALLGYVGVELVNAVVSMLGPFPEGMADFFVPFAGPAAFVWAGALTSPIRSSLVSLALAVTISAALVLSAVLSGATAEHVGLWGQVALGTIMAFIAWKTVMATGRKQPRH